MVHLLPNVAWLKCQTSSLGQKTFFDQSNVLHPIAHSVNITGSQSLCSVALQGLVSVALRPLAGQGPPPIIVSSSVSPLCPVGFVSPLVVKFQVELCNHPDSAAVYYFMAGLKDGAY